MKNEEQATSFSFHLSASAPPAEVQEREAESGPSWFSPTRDALDLDLDAFAASAPAPEVAAAESFAASAPAPTPEVAAAQTTDARPVPQAQAGADTVVVSRAVAAPRVSADDVTRTPAPVDATSPPPPTTRPERGPEVRRIQFPRPPSRSAGGAVSHPTVFSSSLSQAPRVRLDSDEELGDETSGELPPDDLPNASSREAPQRAPAAARPDAHTRTAGNTLSRGVALGRRGAQTSALLVAQAAKRAQALVRAGQQRAQALWTARKGAPLPEAKPEAERETIPAQPASLRKRLARAGEKGPWASAGAALLAGSVAYLAATQLIAARGAGQPSTENTADPSEVPALSHAAPADDSDTTDENVAERAASNAPSPSPTPARDANPAVEPPAPERRGPAGPPPALETLALPDGMRWPGKGLIEVVTEGRELVYVDGVFTGRGPLRRIPIQPGSHEVVVRTEGKERSLRVSVSADKRARVVFGS